MVLGHIVKLLELFLFFGSCSVVLAGIVRTVSVFRLKKGKLVESWKTYAAFMAAVSYIISVLINGFIE